jgi:hypothetical protein
VVRLTEVERQDPSVWVENNFNQLKAGVREKHIGLSSNSEHADQSSQETERQVLVVSGPGFSE